MSTETLPAEKPKRNFNVLFGLTLLLLLIALWIALSVATPSFEVEACSAAAYLNE